MSYSQFVRVIYEDNHLLVVNKPAGVLVQGDKTGDETLIDHCKKYIKERYSKPGNVFLGLVHRLDRPVSGLVVLARTSKTLERMNRIFRERKVQKIYWAVVKNNPGDINAELTHWLKKNKKKNIVDAFENEIPDSHFAELKFRIVGELNGYYLLEVEPLTGRPHQIRIQLSSIGCPIKGDLKYGYPLSNDDGNINLHAKRLYFTHPVRNEPLKLEAPLPQNEFWQQFSVFEDRVVSE